MPPVSVVRISLCWRDVVRAHLPHASSLESCRVKIASAQCGWRQSTRFSAVQALFMSHPTPTAADSVRTLRELNVDRGTTVVSEGPWTARCEAKNKPHRPTYRFPGPPHGLNGLMAYLQDQVYVLIVNVPRIFVQFVRMSK